MVVVVVPQLLLLLVAVVATAVHAYGAVLLDRNNRRLRKLWCIMVVAGAGSACWRESGPGSAYCNCTGRLLARQYVA
jgi:hypothetical protein